MTTNTCKRDDIQFWLLDYAQRNGYNDMADLWKSCKIKEPVLFQVVATLDVILASPDVESFGLATQLMEHVFAVDLDVCPFKVYSKLLLGLKRKLMLHELQKGSIDVHKLLGLHFPQDGLSYPNQSIKDEAQVNHSVEGFRAFILPLISNRRKRWQYFATDYEAEFGASFLEQLRGMMSELLQKVRDRLPTPVIETLFRNQANRPRSACPCAHVELLLHCSRGKCSLTAQDIRSTFEKITSLHECKEQADVQTNYSRTMVGDQRNTTITSIQKSLPKHGISQLDTETTEKCEQKGLDVVSNNKISETDGPSKAVLEVNGDVKNTEVSETVKDNFETTNVCWNRNERSDRFQRSGSDKLAQVKDNDNSDHVPSNNMDVNRNYMSRKLRSIHTVQETRMRSYDKSEIEKGTDFNRRNEKQSQTNRKVKDTNGNKVNRGQLGNVSLTEQHNMKDSVESKSQFNNNDRTVPASVNVTTVCHGNRGPFVKLTLNKPAVITDTVVPGANNNTTCTTNVDSRSEKDSGGGSIHSYSEGTGPPVLSVEHDREKGIENIYTEGIVGEHTDLPVLRNAQNRENYVENIDSISNQHPKRKACVMNDINENIHAVSDDDAGVQDLNFNRHDFSAKRQKLRCNLELHLSEEVQPKYIATVTELLPGNRQSSESLMNVRHGELERDRLDQTNHKTMRFVSEDRSPLKQITCKEFNSGKYSKTDLDCKMKESRTLSKTETWIEETDIPIIEDCFVFIDTDLTADINVKQLQQKEGKIRNEHLQCCEKHVDLSTTDIEHGGDQMFTKVVSRDKNDKSRKSVVNVAETYDTDRTMKSVKGSTKLDTSGRKRRIENQVGVLVNDSTNTGYRIDNHSRDYHNTGSTRKEITENMKRANKSDTKFAKSCRKDRQEDPSMVRRTTMLDSSDGREISENECTMDKIIVNPDKNVIKEMVDHVNILHTNNRSDDKRVVNKTLRTVDEIIVEEEPEIKSTMKYSATEYDPIVKKEMTETEYAEDKKVDKYIGEQKSCENINPVNMIIIRRLDKYIKQNMYICGNAVKKNNVKKNDYSEETKETIDTMNMDDTIIDKQAGKQMDVYTNGRKDTHEPNTACDKTSSQPNMSRINESLEARTTSVKDAPKLGALIGNKNKVVSIPTNHENCQGNERIKNQNTLINQNTKLYKSDEKETAEKEDNVDKTIELGERAVIEINEIVGQPQNSSVEDGLETVIAIVAFTEKYLGVSVNVIIPDAKYMDDNIVMKRCNKMTETQNVLDKTATQLKKRCGNERSNTQDSMFGTSTDVYERDVDVSSESQNAVDDVLTQVETSDREESTQTCIEVETVQEEHTVCKSEKNPAESKQSASDPEEVQDNEPINRSDQFANPQLDCALVIDDSSIVTSHDVFDDDSDVSEEFVNFQAESQETMREYEVESYDADIRTGELLNKDCVHKNDNQEMDLLHSGYGRADSQVIGEGVRSHCSSVSDIYDDCDLDVGSIVPPSNGNSDMEVELDNLEEDVEFEDQLGIDVLPDLSRFLRPS